MLVTALCVARAVRQCLAQSPVPSPDVSQEKALHAVLGARHRMLRMCWQMQVRVCGLTAAAGALSAAQVAYACVAANAWRDEQTRRRFAAAHRHHMAAAATAAAS